MDYTRLRRGGDLVAFGWLVIVSLRSFGSLDLHCQRRLINSNEFTSICHTISFSHDDCIFKKPRHIDHRS